MSDLRRGLAPVPEAAWGEIDGQAATALRVQLAARKLVDVTGPLGWETSAVPLGRVETLSEAPAKGVHAQRRAVLPLMELRAPFALARAELDAAARGAKDPELGPLVEAARAIAAAEDRAVFHGLREAGVTGLCEAAADAALGLPAEPEGWPGVLAEAVGALRSAGVDGPYGLALGASAYTALTRATASGGFPVMEHVRRLLDGPLVWAPALEGGVVMSLRGGDFELVLGEDLSVAYLEHDAEEVRLELRELVTFRALGPEAAVPLAPGRR